MSVNGLWCGMGGYYYMPRPEQHEQIIQFLQQCHDVGIARIFPYFQLTPSFPRYADLDSFRIDTEQVLTYQDYYRNLHWDPLAVLIEEAHKRNIEVHPYFRMGVHGSNWPNWQSVVGERYPITVLSRFANDHPEFWCKDSCGCNSFDRTGYILLSPAFEEVRAYEHQEILTAVRQYGADGVHLECSIDNACFLQDSCGASPFGYEVPILHDWAEKNGTDAVPDNDDRNWQQFRANYTTRYISELRQKSGALPLSVSVTDKAGQAVPLLTDYAAWLQQDLVDEVFLRHTTGDPVAIAQSLEAAKTAAGSLSRISSQLPGTADLQSCAEAARAAGVFHIGIYRADTVDTAGLWPQLSTL